MAPIRLVRATLLAALTGSLSILAPAAELASQLPQAGAARASTGFDGVVEAVRQTVVAAQVPGAIVQLGVKVGDRVSAGQVLARIDARAAEQSASASEAQVQAARAALEVASKDFERQKLLHQKQYISQAALERAESQFKATQAEVNAQLAQAGSARTQSGFYVVRAPFAGVVAEVPVSLGDMAMPGRPLVTLYDPSALRVSAAIPQSAAAQWTPAQLPRIELPGLPGAAGGTVQPVRAQLVPLMDAATHTVQLRADLPAGIKGVAPGMFARLWLPVAATGAVPARSPLSVPAQALVRRAELTGLYVLDAAGKPQLRQVRVGRSEGGQVEILSGLNPGERVATDPVAAAAASAGAR